MGLESLQKNIGDATNVITGAIQKNPTLSILGAGGVGVGTGLLVGSIVGKKAKKRSKRTSASKSKRRKSKRKSSKRRKVKYARTAGKRKDTSHRRIRMTKTGQPYIILASGKARFISKSSARKSRKLKGGRY